MSTPSDRGPAPATATALPDPRVLCRELVTAREALGRCRADRAVTPLVIARARADLLLALEAYVGCLGAHGLPVPYTLRDELRLWRGSLTADQRMRYTDLTRRSAR